MARLRFAYRFVGLLWVMIGVVGLLISIGFLLAGVALDSFMRVQFPELTFLFGPSLRVMPTFQQTLGILLGLFCIVFGSALFGLQSWSRTVGVAVNITLGACVAAVTIAFFLQMQRSGLVSSAMPEWLSVATLLIGGGLAIGLIWVGYHLSTPTAMDAFFGFLPKLPPMQPVKCPTCGGTLNLDKALCPKCDAEDEAPTAPLRAKLIQVQTGQEYLVSTRRQTRVGRETPGFEIQIGDRTVSGEHAMIEYLEGHFYLHALKDTNGTYVNDLGRRIRDVEIKNGDVIAFGQAQFRFITE